MNERGPSAPPGPLACDAAMVPARPRLEVTEFPRGQWSKRQRSMLLVPFWVLSVLSMVTWGFWVAIPAFVVAVVIEAWPGIARVRRLQPMIEQTRDMTALADRGAHADLIAAQEQVYADATSAMEEQIALHDLGHWELRAGNPQRALALLSEVWQRVHREGTWHEEAIPLLQENMAMAYLASGDIEAARAWLPSRAKPSMSPVRSVVEARLGNWEAVKREKYPRLHRSQVELLAHSRRVFHLMKAYAAWSESGVVEDALVDEARPVSDVEYGYLVAEWPTLRNFIEEVVGDARPPDDANLPSARVVSKGDG